jgi:replication factor A1
MKNIVIAGRIKEIHAVKSFNREGGNMGYVGSFVLNDQTGDIRIVLWDEHVKLFKDPNFDINELVKISNGTPKKSKFGGMEIHLGRFSNITLTPDDVDYKLYPKIEFKTTNIGDINLNLSSVSIEGKIIQKFPVKEFARKDGSEGKVGSLTIADSTGSIRVTFWNEQTDELTPIKKEEIVAINNLTPRLSTLDSKTIDLHANQGTIIKKKTKKIEIGSDIAENIKSLQNKTGIVSIKGVISSVDNLKKVNLKSGDEVSLLGFIISDNTDGIRVTLWRDKADEFVDKLSAGKGLLLKNVMIKYSNYSNRNEISLLSDSSIDFIDLDIKDVKEIEPQKREKPSSSFSGNYTKIDSINSADFFEIKGFIAKEINKIVIYEACSKCNRKMDNCTCDEKGDIENRLIIGIIIDDGTSTMRATFFGEIAEKLIGEDTNLIVQLQETPDFDRFLENKSNELLGKDIIMKGRAKFSDFSNSYDLNVSDFTEVDVNKELDRVMKEIET